MTYKVHVDGYNLLLYLTGDEEASPRQGFVYFSDDGDVLALRYDNWKVVFMEQRVQGTLLLWAEPFVALRVPKLYNLRTDPFERADVTSNTYYDWLLENGYIALAATAILTQFLATFRGLPAAPAGGDLHDRPGGREARGGARVGALGAAAGTLASWNDTPTRQAIVDFVEAAARDVPPEERVATFDNDSTLWCEKPMPIQLDFILRRLAEMAAADPKQQGEQPWQAAYERDVTWLGAAVEKHYQGDDGDVKLLVAVPQAFAGLTVEEYDARVTEFFRDGKTRTPARVATPR